jgi:peptide/nickel transport system substrate-binding protein
MKLRTAGLGACLLLALAGCTAGSGGSAPAGPAGGGTFTIGFSSDPGTLDPQLGAGTSLFAATKFAYDSLVSVDGETGEIGSALAKSWQVEGDTVTLTLNEGITCADGTPFTATTAADNLAFVGNPDNQSPFLGTFYPAGATATGDDATATVTITLAGPAPFVLNGLGDLPMVCPSGLADRSTLQTATAGTGPYVLAEALPGDRYTYTRRAGYTWGPDGASTDTPGLPERVVIRVVENETTAANLLLSGELSAAQVVGPDAERLVAAGLFTAQTVAVAGEQWYNHTAGRVTDDPAVRMALTRALDLAELQKVATSGRGEPISTLAQIQPVACPGDSVSGALPTTDPAAAGALLDQAGWVPGPDGVRVKDGRPLNLVFLYQNSLGSSGDAAAELAVQQWRAIGVAATAQSQNETTLTGTIFGAGDWDVAWVALNVGSPDQLVPFLSGPPAPDGTNFAAIADPDYDAAVAAATALGPDGCDAWLDAEAGLIAKASIVPFAAVSVRTFGNGAEFATPGQLVPTSIRMTTS